jgi:nucleotide-binding universal stress UspA family protein
MNWQNILVHVDDGRRAHVRIRVAAEIALKHNAHLIGIAPTGTLVMPFGATDEMMGLQYGTLVEAMRERAQQSLQQFDNQVKELGLRSHECRIADDDAAYATALHARYSDLVVVSQLDVDDPRPSVGPAFVEQVLLQSGRPILVVPRQGELESIGRRPAIAWNSSREAARAVSDALPLLHGAERVCVMVVDAVPSLDGHGAEPGADIALYLARHGINVEVIQESAGSDLGKTLLTCVASFGSDLIVMGGYGHSKFREMLLGGVTRTVLGESSISVLMSH